MLALLMMSACTSKIRADFEEAKRYALEEAGAPPADWRAEAAIWLADDLVEELLLRAVNEALGRSATIDLGSVLGVGASVRPTASLRSVDLKPSRSCQSCVTILLEAGGEATWAVGELGGALPFELSATATFALSTQRSAEGFTLSGDLTELSALELSDLGARGLSVDLSGPMADWARERIVEGVPAMTLAAVGGEDLPLRDLRVVAEQEALRVELLTDAAHGGALALSELAVPAGGWEAAISQETLLDMARRAAFAHGEVSEDIWVEPSGLSVSRERFTLGLRIWKLSGLGWWRDYEVTGGVSLSGSRLVLSPEAATERGASSGAGLVDPLALLASGIILDAIVDAAAQSFPLPDSQRIGASTVRLTPEGLSGRGGSLQISGSATIDGGSDRERGQRDGKRGQQRRPPR